MDIAKSIRVGLAQRNLKQRWLADKLDVSVNYMSMLCTGKKYAGRDQIERLANAFGVPVSEFIKWGE